MTSLSKEMSSRMSRDESDLENISMKVRPMNIVDEFGQMCNSEWLEAKLFLDDISDKNEKYKVKKLSSVMQVCETIF